MNHLHINSLELVLLRKIMPILCIIVPWEFYFYNISYSSGWGIKFSLLYVNFDITYGTIFVNVVQQLSMLSYGGLTPSLLAPSFRTISWFLGALICMVVLINEIFKENLSETFSVHTSGYLLLLCSAFNILGSFVVWSSSFKAIPVGFAFSLFAAYVFLSAKWNMSLTTDDC